MATDGPFQQFIGELGRAWQDASAWLEPQLTWLFEATGGWAVWSPVAIIAALIGWGLWARGEIERRELAGDGESQDVAAELRAGGWWSVGYKRRLTGLLDRFDRWVGDAGMGAGGGAPFLSGRLLDRMLLLALIYPILFAILVWALFADAGTLGRAIGLEPDAPWYGRWALPVAVLCFARGISLLPKVGGWFYMFLGLGAVAGAGAGAFAVAGAVAGAFAFAGAGAFAFAVAGAVAGAFAFASAVAGAFAFVFAGAVAGAFAFAFAGAFAGAVAFAARWRLLWLFYLVYGPLLAVAACTLALGLPGWAEDEEARLAGGAVLVGLLALPLANVLFDFVSVAVTRRLLRLGLAAERYWDKLRYWLTDLAAALGLLVLLAIATAFVLQLFDRLWMAGGAETRLVDIHAVHAAILEGGWTRPEHFWIYAMLLSTLIPTIVHGFVAAGSAGALVGLSQERREEIAGKLERGEYNDRARERGRVALQLAWRRVVGHVLGALGIVSLVIGLIYLLVASRALLWLVDVGVAGADAAAPHVIEALRLLPFF